MAGVRARQHSPKTQRGVTAAAPRVLRKQHHTRQPLSTQPAICVPISLRTLSALYISPHLSAKDFGGSLFAATNLNLLREALAGPVTAASVSRMPHASTVAIPTTKNKLGTALANVQGLCGTLTKDGVSRLHELLMRERPTLIWLDTSILGCLIPLIRRLLPEAKIVCAFQNIETDLVKQRLARMQLHYLPALYATWLNEKHSACESDLTIALHATDAERIASLYGRPVDRILPIIVSDRGSQPGNQINDVDTEEPYVLFVGSAHPPNIEALGFLCRRIAPTLQRFRLVAAGSGLEKFAPRFNHPKLEIKGFVEDLSPIYKNAAAVVAPIFSGGGMKVKIAEALMHGKSVIASPFAAVGYEVCNGNSIRLAQTADEFASQIARLGDDRYNPGSRADYEEFFSRGAGLRRVKEIVATL